MTDTDERPGITQQVWLFLLKEGGRWNIAELAEALCSDSLTVNACIQEMASRGRVARFGRGAVGKVEFGVTLDCRIPNGATMRDLLACGVAAVKETA